MSGNTTSTVYNGAQQTNAYTVSGLAGTDTASSIGLTVGGNATATHVSQGKQTDALTATIGTAANVQDYTIAKTNGSLTLTAASLTVTGNTTNSAYSGGQQVNTYGVTGLKGTDTASSIGLSVSGSAIATHVSEGTVADSLSGSKVTSQDYKLVTSNGSLTITPVSLSVTGDTSSNVYNGAQQTNTYTVNGLQGSDTASSIGLSVTGSATATHVSQGTVSDALSVKVGSGDYTPTVQGGSLKITPATLNVNGSSTTSNENGATQTNSAANVSGLQGSDTSSSIGLSISGYGSGVTAGTYADSLKASANSDYAVVVKNGALTIKAATTTTTTTTTTTSINLVPTIVLPTTAQPTARSIITAATAQNANAGSFSLASVDEKLKTDAEVCTTDSPGGCECSSAADGAEICMIPEVQADGKEKLE